MEKKIIFALLCISMSLLVGCTTLETNIQKVKVTDELLTPDKLLCSPDGGEGVPMCLSLAAIDEEKSVAVENGLIQIANKRELYEYPDEKYDFVRSGLSAGKCPSAGEDDPIEIIINDHLNRDSVPYGGNALIAYFCPTINQFWIYEFDDKKAPYPFWYGPYEGYPVK